ncbi:hypothetical protein TKK_0016980 [Trichogramma kaykai]
MAEFVKSRCSNYHPSLGGFLYYKNGGTIGKRAYWLCKKTPQCCVRAVTTDGPEDLQMVKGAASDHMINLRKGISRHRLKTMPSNPQSIDELQEIAKNYRQTLFGKQFVMYDSFEDEDDDYEEGRWFVDVIFKSAPTIFFQLFAIMGRPVTVMSDFELAVINAGTTAVLQQKARTNNVSEEWHNRLIVVMGRDHPSFYAFLTEIKKEQADTENLLRQLGN